MRIWICLIALALGSVACDKPSNEQPEETKQEAPAAQVQPPAEMTGVWSGETLKGPLLVVLHGYGANEKDLRGLGPQLRLPMVSLRGIVPLEAGKYAWFPLEFQEQDVTVPTTEMRHATDSVIAFLEALPAEKKASGIIIGGFSQGAIVAMDAVTHRPDLFTAAFSLSGREPSEFRAAEGGKKPPIFIAHGDGDSVIALRRSQLLRDAVQNAGHTVDYHEYKGLAHKLSPDEVADLRNFARAFVK